ncbi:MerR family transcriptional regulator [Vibrio panuliri]|uniref:Helix-turn-helix-type transcriptional regulator n=1 Tax=Vibrio panuliri TaxID=1381081 RepID=A0ABX3FNJ6_9VIBR|nr:MerR family transcriptional regulator [Vibrio panuliri]KAB1458195.1 MerR family transcriptional regulator [Vibrio panuliri]OLQ95517.1 helix-turn-helix-type transcriptional regulator [Vibrio panuliri]
MGCKEKLYAIREVSEVTGIKPVTLRAWQRRYNIIQPERTEKGHRLYTDTHIEQIKTIQGWLEKGVAIGKVKALLESEAGVEDVSLANSQLEEVEAMLTALALLNRSKAESVLSQVCKEYPLDILQHRFIQPIFDALSSVKRSQRTLQQGMFNSLVMAQLSFILEAENKVAPQGRCLLVSYEELGSIELRLWALKLSEQGFSVNFIEGVDDVSALVDHDGLKKYQAVSLFASQAPSQVQIESVKVLQGRLAENLILNPLLDSLTKI